MKKHIILLATIVVAAIAWFLLHQKLIAAEPGGFQSYEYFTIRWGGRDNTHLIRANGKVEMLGSILTKLNRPDRADDRAYYMNIAMNAVAREGYEFAGMTNDEIVMRRAVPR